MFDGTFAFEGVSNAVPTVYLKKFTSVYYCEVISCKLSGYICISDYMDYHQSQADHRQRHENHFSGFMLHCLVKPSSRTDELTANSHIHFCRVIYLEVISDLSQL